MTSASGSCPDSRPRSSARGSLRILLPAGTALVVVGGLALSVDGQIAPVLFCADPVLLGLAALKGPGLVLVWASRWHLVLRARRLPVRFGQTLRAVFIRVFFNNLTPGFGTGGEPVAAYALGRQCGIATSDALASTIAERVLQGVSLGVLLGLVAVTLLPDLDLPEGTRRVAIAAVAGYAVLMAIGLYLTARRTEWLRRAVSSFVRGTERWVPNLSHRWRLRRLDDGFDRFLGAYRASLSVPRASAGIFGLTAIHWGMDVVQHDLLFRALGVTVPLWAIVVTATVVKIACILPIVPGGSGLVEALTFGLYATLLDLPGDVIVGETLLYRAFDAWVLWAASGIVTAFTSSAFVPEQTEADHRASRIRGSSGGVTS